MTTQYIFYHSAMCDAISVLAPSERLVACSVRIPPFIRNKKVPDKAWRPNIKFGLNKLFGA